MLMEAQKKADRSREEVLTKSKQVEKLQIIINNLQDKVHKITFLRYIGLERDSLILFLFFFDCGKQLLAHLYV